MNSPPERSSPSSTPSSGSPPPEETNYPPSTSGGYLANLTSHLTATFGGSPSSSKRRLPTGPSFGAASSARDPKTRRRGESGRQNSSTGWDGQGLAIAKKEKDELIDHALVEYLRKEIGDPFLETGIKG
ncbi:hypothetical protein B0H34DRAFT_333025 [Crassisporium funariophilum]|nr:hypothetical protein B0H34DRAFT_333025 [Crassisporium funariophilum]